jgi:hypothetical protein
MRIENIYISFFFSLNKRKSIKKLENRDKEIKKIGEKKESNWDRKFLFFRTTLLFLCLFI